MYFLIFIIIFRFKELKILNNKLRKPKIWGKVLVVIKLNLEGIFGTLKKKKIWIKKILRIFRDKRDKYIIGDNYQFAWVLL